MTSFFEQPILNSPYERPDRHWELDAAGQPTNVILAQRRSSSLLTPIPKPKKSACQKSDARTGRTSETDLISSEARLGFSTIRNKGAEPWE